MMDESVVEECRRILAQHARSFRWASVLLPRHMAYEAALAYAFCRIADDTADEAPDIETARAGLDALLFDFNNPQRARPIVRAFADLVDRRAIPRGVVEDLFHGLIADQKAVRLQNDDELLTYCYQVAGTVGLMMCGILGVGDPAARRHAMDLGIGMQLTNICRDVHEDLGRNRIYIPNDRLHAAGITADSLFVANAAPTGLDNVVLDLLDLAETRYQSAERGMRFIPLRARFAIVAASRIYRAIGLGIRKRHGDVWAHRVRVGPWGKLAWLFRAALSTPFFPRAKTRGRRLLAS
jgi:phytoene synthase